MNSQEAKILSKMQVLKDREEEELILQEAKERIQNEKFESYINSLVEKNDYESMFKILFKSIASSSYKNLHIVPLKEQLKEALELSSGPPLYITISKTNYNVGLYTGMEKNLNKSINIDQCIYGIEDLIKILKETLYYSDSDYIIRFFQKMLKVINNIRK